MARILPMVLALMLGGCGGGFFSGAQPEVTPPETDVGPQPDVQQVAAPVRTPPPTARTAAQFDVTTVAERKTAAATPTDPGGEAALGETVASLGDPSRAGFWLETPLVSQPGKGRVFFAATGKSAQVDLIPIDGPSTAGSRLSLPAMRLIDAPLTDLPVIDVFSAG